MICNIEKHDLSLIVDALDSYQLDIEHGNSNGHKYVWAENDVTNLRDQLNDILETTNER
jgi:hypothetical protein